MATTPSFTNFAKRHLARNSGQPSFSSVDNSLAESGGGSPGSGGMPGSADPYAIQSPDVLGKLAFTMAAQGQAPGQKPGGGASPEDIFKFTAAAGAGGGVSAMASNGGQWKLGQAPSHYGYAGMQEPAKQWVLRTLGQFPGLRFSSGLRSPEQNAAVGGVPNSGHMRGWKADYSGNSKLLYQAADWAQKNGARTLLHDAGNGFHLDVSYERAPL